jgi:malonate transporter MadL subunit
MTIYGVGILAICYLMGQLLGELLGRFLNIEANVGGVGFGMILLILFNEWLSKRDLLPAPTQQGILFWSSLYIPVIVAMSATQNVAAAFSGGYMAIVAGAIPTIAMFMLVPVMVKLGKSKNNGA